MIQQKATVTHELLSLALSHLGEGVMITDNNLQRPGPRILYVNPAMCRISGYTQEEILNQSPRIFQGEETDRKKLAILKDELTHGRECTVELVNYGKNGKKFDVALFLSPILNAQGECTHYVSVVRDLTDQKRTARELRTQQQHLNAVLNTTVDSIVTIDQRGIIVSANRATTQMFGYTSEELLGANVNILMPEPFHREHDRYIRNFLETGHAKIIGTGRELSARRKNGELFPIDLAVTQVDDTGMFTGVIRELTSRRALQRQVLEVASAQQEKIGFVLQEEIAQDLAALHLLASTLVQCVSVIAENSPASQSDENQPKQMEQAQLARLANRLAVCSREAIKNLSSLTRGIMPVQPDAQGLNVALEELCNSLTCDSGPTCRFVCKTPIKVANHNVATHVYHIIREALAKLVVGAGPSHIDLCMSSEQDELKFELIHHAELPDASLVPHPSSDIISPVMKYRAGIIGASLAEHPDGAGETAFLLRIHSASTAASETDRLGLE